MPIEPVRNFFQTRETDRPHTRWPVLPVSIATHAAVAVAIFIIPLTAEVELPAPAPISRTLQVLQVKPIPVPPPISAGRRSPSPMRDAAPTFAPPTIEPEVPAPPIGNTDAPPIDGGLPFGEIGGAQPLHPVAPPPPEPPPPPPSGPLPVGKGIREPKKIAHVAPIYPVIARSARVEGTVVLEAVINERGVVDKIRVLRSEPLLDNAAIEAVRGWRYTPTLLNGVPIQVLLTITVNFQLDR